MAWPVNELSITCERSGMEHLVSIARPVRSDALEKAPLLLCLDGPWMFGTTVDASRIMSMSGEAPEAIVVGLSFADSSMGEYLRQRARWFTPTPWVPPVETGVKGLDADECGRAEILLAFIKDQLMPSMIGQHLPDLGIESEVGDRWFIGHSFSALFGLRALFTDPTLFDRWLLASPSIWWHDRAILASEAAYAADHNDLPARVFTSYGENETKPKASYPFNMGSNVEDLLATLKTREYPNLQVTHKVLEGDDHSSSIGAAISKGLRALHA